MSSCAVVRAVFLAGALAAVTPEANAADPAWVDWTLHCQGCHRADGSGSPGGAPSLRGVAAFLRRPGGRAYLARVPGVLDAPLGDADAARLLNWMLERYDSADIPPDHQPYGPEDIALARRSPLGVDALAKRRELLTPYASVARPH